MVDKSMAVSMRKMGMIYKDIAISLGCSHSWCKRNLKGVTQEYSVGNEQLDVKKQAIEILEEALMKIRSLG